MPGRGDGCAGKVTEGLALVSSWRATGRRRSKIAENRDAGSRLAASQNRAARRGRAKVTPPSRMSPQDASYTTPDGTRLARFAECRRSSGE